MSIQHDVQDLNLADAGRESIEWADRQMPVLRLIRERFERERPLDDGANVVSYLHKERRDVLEGIIGGTEETTTGIIRRHLSL